jgi:hypothetical protein
MSTTSTTTFNENVHEISDLEEQLNQNKVDVKLYWRIIEIVTKGPLTRPDLIVRCGREILFGDHSSTYKKQVDVVECKLLYAYACV